METSLSKEDSDQITYIMLRMVARNMQAGANFETAKMQAHNRMDLEHPDILAAWIVTNKSKH